MIPVRHLLLVAAASLWSAAQAQQLIPTRGKDFWLGFMQNYDGASGQLSLYVSSTVNTSGTMTVPLQGFVLPFTVTANVVTQVTVPFIMMNQGSETLGTSGIRVQTHDTVAVYALNFQTATADAAVIYPTRSLGTDYRVQAFYGLDGFGSLNSELLVVGTADGTVVEITPAVATLGGHPAGVPFTVNMNAGQTYQVQAATSAGDLTGTVVRGTPESGDCRPFAVFSGSVCPDVPTGCFACDHVFDQDLPTPFWGTTYYSVPWQDTYAYLYRILADQDNTHVSVDNGPPITLNAGEFNEVSGTNDPHCFSGDKPFSVAQYMMGSDCSGNSDPALLLLNATEQKINDVTFATVVSGNITAQYINVVVDASDVSSVSLDGNSVPAVQFTAFPACTDHYYARLALDQGSHRITCPAGLTGYVYGTGPNYETYAYSIGSFTPLPPLNYDTVYCGLDTNDVVTLSPPEPIFNPVWYTESDPNDTLFEGLSYTFQPSASDVYVVSGTENLSGCTQQYFFSVELGEPPTPSIQPPPPVCAYSPVHIDLQLDPPGTYVYEWSPQAGVADPHVQDPVITPSHSGWYHVTITSQTGCNSTQDSVYVTVTDGNVTHVGLSSDPTIVCAGHSAQLHAAVDQIIAEDAFDQNIGPIWQQVENGAVNNICGSVTGNALRFDGDGLREAHTVALDVSNGGSVRFALKIATGTAPCEDVDPGENIVVEYSINGGGSWSLMANYGDNAFPEFGSVLLPIPVPAQTTATLFRWRQLLNSGLGQDNWVLDDVAIAATNNNGMSFSWSPSATLNDPSIADPLATPAATQVYTLEVVDQQTGCHYQQDVQVAVGTPFDLELTNDTAVCGLGAGVVLDAHPVQGGSYSWQWTPDDNSLSSTTIEAPFAIPMATTQYIVHVTNQAGCTVTDTVQVTVATLLSITTFSTPDPICQGQAVQLQVQAFQGSGNYTYAWTPANTLDNAASATPIGHPQSTTTYLVTVTDNICGASQQASATVHVDPAPAVDLGADQVICSGTSTTLDAGSADSYLWNTQATTQTIVVDASGTYWVQAHTGNCVGGDTVTVTLAPLPGQLGYTAYNCEGSPITLSIPYTGGTYHWEHGENTQSITVSEFGDYAFTLTDVYGCTYQDIVHLAADPLGFGVVVPNVISPNGDGKNDFFEPQAGGSPDVAVSIFNRFGQEIFSSGTLNTLWNGRHGSDPVPDGTYYYVVRYKPVCDSEEHVQKGTVTVVR